MQKLNRYVACLSVFVLFSVIMACDKNGNSQDVGGPQITVYNPSNGDQFQFQDTVFLSANITDASELQEVVVLLINGADTVEIWPPAPVIFGNVTQYTIDDLVINNVGVADTTNAILRFQAMDKHDNSSYDDIQIILF